VRIGNPPFVVERRRSLWQEKFAEVSKNCRAAADSGEIAFAPVNGNNLFLSINSRLFSPSLIGPDLAPCILRAL
jgi:hypothetical protein